MAPLHTKLRGDLEKAVVKAREKAETGAKAALEALAVHQAEPYKDLTPDQRELRKRLRAKARQLGDKQEADKFPSLKRLIHECAYEHWHQMLFARFLAENSLLIHPGHNVAVTLDECDDLAKEDGLRDRWEAASRYASRMLPQIFRPDDPVLEVQLAPEHKQAMKKLLEELPVEIFTADDSLGWVYQYWQKAMKDAANKSGEKIDADSLPAVTQLFTEHYMVLFLLHNTLGAWWVGKHPGEEPPMELEYLRSLEDGTPAAGIFPGWPQTAKELKILDPCCGSGHFLVAAFDMMVRIRMHDESLSARDACDAVISDNIHGLEIDARCTQIAAFALAMAAWKFPDSGGYRTFPEMSIACSGLSVGGKKEEWLKLANGDPRLKSNMEMLYDLFANATIFGSLIDPRSGQAGGFVRSEIDRMLPLLAEAMQRYEVKSDPNKEAVGVVAQGIVRATELLLNKYSLVITNVPYLARGKQNQQLKDFCEKYYNNSKTNLGVVFVERCLAYLAEGGTSALVTPQDWLALTSYTNLRVNVLVMRELNLSCKLGFKGFSTPMWDLNVMLLAISANQVAEDHLFSGIDLSSAGTAEEKSHRAVTNPVQRANQSAQRKNPDSRITFDEERECSLLLQFARSYKGVTTGDDLHYVRCFWEFPSIGEGWAKFQSTVSETIHDGGCACIVWMKEMTSPVKQGVYIRAAEAWGKQGIAVSQMNSLPISRYQGVPFDTNVGAIIPNNSEDFSAIWAFCGSSDYSQAVRRIDQTLKVTNATLAKVPFDLEYWTRVAREKYPNGLPEPYSNDPTQWLFKGDISRSTNPLHVAVARLLGYRWPDQPKDDLDELCDDDGIVCLPAVRGETPAADRLRNLLTKAYGAEWNSSKSEELLAIAGSSGKTMDEWLRKYFFEQHCQLFHQRPFIWHISDGQRDGFAALVNYHMLDRKLLEKLIFTYLGDWIRQQDISQSKGEAGAEAKVLAARKLQDNLKKIAEGDAPYDIFVRWKPIEKQPIGWEPDLNDGVRMNIRPFMNAGVLFKQPKIKWDKDRGKDPESAPWFKVFKGERINDHHLTLAEKKAAREKAGVA